MKHTKNFSWWQEVSRVELRAELLSERVADLCQRRRNERIARSACRAWFGHAQQAGQARENARLAGLWHRRQGLASAMTRWGGGHHEIPGSARVPRFVLRHHTFFVCLCVCVCVCIQRQELVAVPEPVYELPVPALFFTRGTSHAKRRDFSFALGGGDSSP